ncbi:MULTISPECIES: response regulator [unclassified Methylobacterium]|uniref:response regulator transcription factor n=1 Tax=unclassified Methylobacterium TaxID=2615210 RepID=UPI0006F26CA9|nr:MULTISPECIES: response regulator [unclassified Methylobacterium]KQO57621.1 two-component system response regulator [Methylobacterium sp. Leaf86]KQO94573.1 two-component system response regulator [Methylobacterium sp. Leaf91]
MPAPPVIAIVDDDEDVRVATGSLVRSLGYTARIYASARDFLATCSSDAPDCVITDVQMPGMTGVEMQKGLRALGSRVPVIFVTAFPTEALRETLLAAGASDFLGKPCDGATIIRSLEQALTGRSTRDATA